MGIGNSIDNDIKQVCKWYIGVRLFSWTVQELTNELSRIITGEFQVTVIQSEEKMVEWFYVKKIVIKFGNGNELIVGGD